MALAEARDAEVDGEIPIGAVIICKDRVIAKTHNQTELLHDVTAHAEMLAITSACNYLGAKYLTDCTLFVTVEPCPMCAGALAWTQISEIVYGADDEKRGYSTISDKILHPKTKVVKGVLASECEEIIKNFFISARLKNK